MQKTTTNPLSKDEVLQRFGVAVRSLRENQELTQERLAELSDMHVTYISQIERGLKNLSLFNVHRLADALRVSPAEFFAAGYAKRSGR